MMSASARRVGRWVAVAVLAALLVLAVRRIDGALLLDTLRAARIAWIVAALCSFVAILPLWALQWRLLAPRVPGNTFRRMLRVIAMTSSLLNTTALFVGEAGAFVFLVTQIGLTRAAALSVGAMDQLLVGLAKLAVLTTAAFLLTLPAWMARGVVALSLGVTFLLVVCLLAAWHHEWLERQFARFVPSAVATGIGGVGQALAPMRSLRRGGGALLIALGKKSVEASAILCVQHAFGINLPPGSAVLVLAALNLSTLLPLVPGNAGVYEGTVAFIYVRLGVSTEQAVGMAVVQHACYFVALAVPGYWWLARSGATHSVAAAR